MSSCHVSRTHFALFVKTMMTNPFRKNNNDNTLKACLWIDFRIYRVQWLGSKILVTCAPSYILKYLFSYGPVCPFMVPTSFRASTRMISHCVSTQRRKKCANQITLKILPPAIPTASSPKQADANAFCGGCVRNKISDFASPLRLKKEELNKSNNYAASTHEHNIFAYPLLPLLISDFIKAIPYTNSNAKYARRRKVGEGSLTTWTLCQGSSRSHRHLEM
jgi:hypothetical protein